MNKMSLDDGLIFERDDYRRKMNMAFKQTEAYETLVRELRSELDIMYQKVTNVERDRDISKNILSQQLTEFNRKQNLYIEEIQDLKTMIRGLKVK